MASRIRCMAWAFTRIISTRAGAIDSADIDTSYALVKEIGCTAVRLRALSASQLRIFSLRPQRISGLGRDSAGKSHHGFAAFYANAQQQLRELIKQNFNHPSICFWSLFNELGPHTRTDWKLVDELNDEAHKLDPSRLTTSASHLPARFPVSWIPDLHTFNRYYGWYMDTIYDWPARLDTLHKEHPDQNVGISEYGAGASVFQHAVHPTTQPLVIGNWHPEEWQAIVHEHAYAAMKQRPWLWGTFVWSMFDFAADERNEGDQPGRNDKGLVTIDRAVKKDAFYFYKANWSKEPFVYITSRRFNLHPTGSVQFKIYSNCDSVRLTVNDRPVDLRNSGDGIFVSGPFDLQPGNCEIRAIGKKEDHQFDDKVLWTVSSSVPSSEPSATPTSQPLSGPATKPAD